MRPTDAALELGVSRNRVNELIREGKLVKVRKHDRTYTTVASVQAYAFQQKQAAW